MRKIGKGMMFRYKSKYSDSFYFGVVASISYVINPEYEVYFYAENGVGYRYDEVEWIDEIRDEKLKELGL
jgi:hypothetical protein